MTEHRIVPRAECGLPAQVFNNDGQTLRGPMRRPCQRVALHYTGSRRTFGMPTLGEAAAILRGLEANAKATDKSNEYNYCVTNTDDFTVLEYAGTRQAAHSPGENANTYSILLVVGGVDPNDDTIAREAPSLAAINKVRWLINRLRDEGHLTRDCEITKHRLLPGAATVCPGSAVEACFEEFLQPFVAGGIPSSSPGAAPSPASDATPVGFVAEIGLGDVGNSVFLLQCLLIQHRVISDVEENRDGKFEGGTQGAVMRFQKSRGLPEHGRVDLPTWKALGLCG